MFSLTLAVLHACLLLAVVQHNFTLVVLGIVAVSVLPVVFEVMAARKGHGGSAAGGASS
jgi:hypothetical protein